MNLRRQTLDGASRNISRLNTAIDRAKVLLSFIVVLLLLSSVTPLRTASSDTTCNAAVVLVDDPRMLDRI